MLHVSLVVYMYKQCSSTVKIPKLFDVLKINYLSFKLQITSPYKPRCLTNKWFKYCYKHLKYMQEGCNENE